MKKVILAILMVFFSCAVCAEDSKYIETQFKKKRRVQAGTGLIEGRCGFDPSIPLVIGSYATNPPFSWVEVKKTENGEMSYALRGYNVDFMKQVAKDLKLKMSVRAYKTDKEVLRALQTGEISAFMGLYYDPKFRKAGYSYVLPSYFSNIIGTVVLKERNLDLKTMDDLKNLKGAVRVDERFYNYVHLSLPENLDIQQVPDSRTAFFKLLKGEVDYLISSPYAAEAEARRYKMNRDIKLQSLPLPKQEFFIVFSPVSPCKDLNKLIARYLTQKDTDENARVQRLIGYIDGWGQRFRNDMGLAAELKAKEEKQAQKAAETEPIPNAPETEKTEPTPQGENMPTQPAESVAEKSVEPTPEQPTTATIPSQEKQQ